MVTWEAPAIAVDEEALARLGTALGDGTRRRLLLALLEGPAHPSELADRLGLTRGNVSNHLACLRGCGLVTTTPVGRRVRYELADPRLGDALARLAALVLVIDHGSCPPDGDCCEGDPA
jgi:DNA-binding transcriptional ArsR family regulator